MATTEEHCTGCENACPINALSCAKGRALHGIAETATKETLVRKLIRAVHAPDRLQMISTVGDWKKIW